MSFTTEKLQRLQLSLKDAGIQFRIAGADYNLPGNAEVTNERQLYVSGVRDEEYTPTYNLTLGLNGLTISVRGLDRHSFGNCSPTLTAYMEGEHMILGLDDGDLYMFDRAKEADELRAKLQSVANDLAYQIKFD